MGLFARVLQWIRKLVSSDSPAAAQGDESDAAAPEGPDHSDEIGSNPSDRFDFDPESISSRAEIVRETGLTPGTFIMKLTMAHGGRLQQSEIEQYVNLSSGSISRLLTELEEDGVIVRIRVGRQKLVCLPDKTPSMATNFQDATKEEAE